MMAEFSTELDPFQELLNQAFASLPQDPLSKVRAKAWDHFLELGLPTRKSDVFRYVKLRALYDKSLAMAEQGPNVTSAQIDPFLLPECHNSVLVFVNGVFHPGLSRLSDLPKKVVVAPLTEAFKTFATFLQNHWAKTIKEETDPFAILNTALHQGGVFIYAPPKTVFDKPLQILHVLDTQQKNLMLFPRFHLFAGNFAELLLCSTQGVISGSNCFVDFAADFSLEEGAKLRYVQHSYKEPTGAVYFEAVRAQLKGNATFKTFNVTEGAECQRYDYKVALQGENGEALLYGLWMGKGKNEVHTHVLMDHQAPHCHSFQFFKGVLDESSHSSFEGKILVRQAAQKTDAFQLNNNLLLSEGAAAESKPNLEIFADDVKASHGATVGQLDEEQLFYMKTRGFSAGAAKNLLVGGFCTEIIENIPVESLKNKALERAHQFYEH